MSICSKSLILLQVSEKESCMYPWRQNMLEDIKSGKKKKLEGIFTSFLLSGLYLPWGQITWRCQILCNKWPSGPLMLGGQEMQNLCTWLQALFALGKMVTELLVSLGQKTVCSFGATTNWIPFSSTLFLIIALYMHILYVKHFLFKLLQRVRNVSQPSFPPQWRGMRWDPVSMCMGAEHVFDSLNRDRGEPWETLATQSSKYVRVVFCYFFLRQKLRSLKRTCLNFSVCVLNTSSL